jgi:hypothetical protein
MELSVSPLGMEKPIPEPVNYFTGLLAVTLPEPSFILKTAPFRHPYARRVIRCTL